jgi:hypothetical protein
MVAASFLVAATTYGLFGWDYSKRAAAIGARSEAERLIEEKARNNPTLANDLARLRQDYGDVALATKLALDARQATESLALTPLTEQLKRKEPVHEAILVNLVQTTGMNPGDPALETFLAGYDTAIRILPNAAQRKDVLASLRESSRSPDDWSFVRRGYDALLVWRATRRDPALWQLYKRDYAWLSGMIPARTVREAETVSGSDGDISVDVLEHRIRALLGVAARHGDLLERLYSESPEQAILAYHVIETYGDTLEITTKRYGLPLLETTEVIYANPEVLNTYWATHGGGRERAEFQAALLSGVYKEHPSVWTYARATPLALQLYLDAPQHAEVVLERYGSNPGFLLEIYDTYGPHATTDDTVLLVNVIASLAQYKDVAARLLFDYRDNREFRSAISNPAIGTRIVPFVARFPEMLVAVNVDPRYVDKYFYADGRLKDADQWWEAVPGGSILKLAANLKNGYPCDWGEVGWAVFDVADVGLMVFTAGTAEAVTSGIKGAVKGGARVAAGILKASQGVRKVIPGIGGKEAARIDLREAAKGITKAGDDLALRIAPASAPEWLPTWKRIGYALMATKLYARGSLVAEAPRQIGESLAGVAIEIASAPGKVLVGISKEMLQRSGARLESLPAPLVHVLLVLGLLGLAHMSWRRLRTHHAKVL